MTTLTYGVLPSKSSFDAAFEKEVDDPKGFRIKLGRSDSLACEEFKLGDGYWPPDALWVAINEIVIADMLPSFDESETAMNLVSGILSVLGFEWV